MCRENLMGIRVIIIFKQLFLVCTVVYVKYINYDCRSNHLLTGQEFFVGISEWTNEAGARAVAAAFPEYPCTPIKVKPHTLITGNLTSGTLQVSVHR